MKKIRILYIANVLSIHDKKWMSSISVKDNFEVYISSHLDELSQMTETDYSFLKANDISLGPPITTFSLKNYLTTRKTGRKLSSFVNENQIDLIHVLFATPNILWSSFLSIPLIVTTRGSDVQVVLPALRKSRGLRFFHDRILLQRFKKAFTRSFAITCTSNSQIEGLHSLFKLQEKKISLVRTGVDIDRIDNSNSLPLELVDKQIVFSPRFINEIYDTLLQVDAIEKLPEELIQKYFFVFISGKNNKTDYFINTRIRLNELSKSRGLAFQIIESLDQESMWTVFKKSSLTIMTPVKDGTPNSALEAMVAHSPLIIPDLGFDKDLFSDNSMVLKKRNPDSLAILIETALKKYPEKYLTKARKDVVSYGCREKEMKKLEVIYRKAYTSYC